MDSKDAAATTAPTPQGEDPDPASTAPLTRPKGRKNNIRWWMTGLCSLAFVFNYMDRTTLSVALPFMGEDLHISETTQGLLLGVFFVGYAFCQLPAGKLVDKYGVKPVFAIGALIWGAVTMLTGLVRGPVELVLARLGLGVGEASAYPASAKVVSRWFPNRERTLGNAIWDAGSRVGAVISLPIITALIAWAGWRVAFYVAGALALGWVLLWWKAYHDPQKHPKVTDAELDYIRKGGARLEDIQEDGTTTTAKVQWKQLFRYRTVWGMMIGFFCLNYSNFFFITWFPAFLVKDRGFNLAELGIFGMIPGFVAIGGSLGGGVVADALLRRGWSVNKARKTCLVLGMTGASTIAPAVFVESAAGMIALLSLCCASLAFAGASVASLPADVAPEPGQVSSLAGIQNFASNIAGFVGPIITGAIVASTGSFMFALVFSGGLAVIGALAYGLLIKKVEPLPVLSS
ncbi:MFS transporter [Streptomyces sp. BI20]|uniref:MFS transporter n=1 Tax=Streptomyces sp. BI20 TaxID=3403460 RepID=UPI003C75BD46